MRIRGRWDLLSLVIVLTGATIASSVHAQTAPPRIAMSNGLTFPYTNQLTASNIRHYQKLRVVPSAQNAIYSKIQLTYSNFVEINGGESIDYQPVRVQAEILYNGVYYPVKFNGQPSATMNGGQSVTGSVDGLTLRAGALFYERVRLEGLQTGQQRYLVSHNARAIMIEGALAGTDPGVNLLGGKEGHGATCAFSIQAQKITAITIKTPGTNYTAGGVVHAWDDARQTEATVGYTVPTNGRMTSAVVTDGGANYTGNTRCFIAGGGGFGQNAAIYAASMITGLPNVAGVKSLLIVGDSIARGYGSSDAKGDMGANYGIFERAVRNRFATASTALPGNTATAYRNLTSHQRMYAVVLPYVTHAVINLGTNDLAMGYSASVIANANNLSAAELRRAGIKVAFATLIPRVSGSYATLAGQTPVAGFERGGAADTYNGWVRARTNGLTSDWNVVDARAAYEDSSDKSKWRVNAVMTNDGIHPNLTGGIPSGANQLAARFSALP